MDENELQRMKDDLLQYLVEQYNDGSTHTFSVEASVTTGEQLDVLFGFLNEKCQQLKPHHFKVTVRVTP